MVHETVTSKLNTLQSDRHMDVIKPMGENKCMLNPAPLKRLQTCINKTVGICNMVIEKQQQQRNIHYMSTNINLYIFNVVKKKKKKSKQSIMYLKQ